VARLRELAHAALRRTYQPAEATFGFRLRKTASGIVREGSSLRYSAICAIGLAGEDGRDVRSILGTSLSSLGERLLDRPQALDRLGDASLTLWAAALAGCAGRERAHERIAALDPIASSHPTVELAWTLAALCQDPAAPAELRDRLAARLREASDTRTGLFPHVIGGRPGLRSHVSCFADLVYPIQALSFHAQLTGERGSLATAERCAARVCSLQGSAGQWWWHYDLRTGGVIEGYPVYAVHQDAMGPMALFALRDAGGSDYSEHARRGLEWLARSPELGGGSLIDMREGVIWRKVARREPGKASRSLQALASRFVPGARLPGLDRLFPPGAVDFESRPYHMGWLLHAWPRQAGDRW
jgi:hypothetical protein